MNKYLLLKLMVVLLILSACGSGEQEKEDITEIQLQSEGLITQSSQEVTEHPTFEQLTGLFEKLIENNPEGTLGLVPLAEETINHLSAFFPAKLMSYYQTINEAVSFEEEHLHIFSSVYEKEDEAVTFTIYQFESSLKILEFFMALDSIYQTNPNLVINEIKIDGLEGWEVLGKNGEKHEVCLVLPDTRLIQGSAAKVFMGDLNAMFSELSLTSL
ncbi:MAG: hypothetical protein EA362_08255 [Saprospirales bacterium]|nr:MAG: hypothetical protein EA362_08255 [Saprospirales bacterium]